MTAQAALATDTPLDQLIDDPQVRAEYPSFEERARTLVPRFMLDVWNDKNIETTKLIWSRDIVFHSPIDGSIVKGFDPLLEFANQVLGAFDDFHYDVQDVVVDGDKVVLRMVQTGKHTGDYFGLPPTGRRVRMNEVFIFRVAPKGPVGVLIEEVWLLLNILHLTQQMGLFPKGNPPRPLLKMVVALQKLGRKIARRGDDG
jgi:predicted ester cyclase